MTGPEPKQYSAPAICFGNFCTQLFLIITTWTNNISIACYHLYDALAGSVRSLGLGSSPKTLSCKLCANAFMDSPILLGSGIANCREQSLHYLAYKNIELHRTLAASIHSWSMIQIGTITNYKRLEWVYSHMHFHFGFICIHIQLNLL